MLGPAHEGDQEQQARGSGHIVAGVICGACLTVVAWAAQGWRLGIPLAALWLLSEACLPRVRGKAGRRNELLEAAQRVVDGLGCGGVVVAGILFIVGGVDRLTSPSLAGCLMVATGSALTGAALGLLSLPLRERPPRSGSGRLRSNPPGFDRLRRLDGPGGTRPASRPDLADRPWPAAAQRRAGWLFRER